MRWIVLGALAGGLLVGCSSSGGSESAAAAAEGAAWAAPAATSGSRLRAKVLTAGGARELVAFFDTARNEECTFQEVIGGRFRCLPASIFGTVSQLFADAACTTQAVQVQSCVSDVKYVATPVSSGCNGPAGTSTPVISEVRPVTGVVTTSYFKNAGSCTAQQTGGIPTQLTTLAVGDRIALDEFVEATITTETHEGITHRIAVSTDGARQHLGYRDAALDVDCAFQVMADGATRCAPAAAIGQLVYSDSNCTQPIGAISVKTGSCQSGAIAREVDPATGCARAFYQVGPGTSSTDVEAGYIGSTNPRGCSTMYRPQSIIPLTNVTSSLPKLDRVSGGTGRLVPALVSGRSSDELVVGWHDVEKGVDCQFAKANDGKIRCLPTGESGLAFYTDTACKSPQRLAALSGQRGCVPNANKFVRTTEAACTTGAGRFDVTTRVFALTGLERNVGPSSVETSPGRCVTVAGIVGAYDATEVNPADYVEANVVTE